MILWLLFTDRQVSCMRKWTGNSTGTFLGMEIRPTKASWPTWTGRVCTRPAATCISSHIRATTTAIVTSTLQSVRIKTLPLYMAESICHVELLTDADLSLCLSYFYMMIFHCNSSKWNLLKKYIFPWDFALILPRFELFGELVSFLLKHLNSAMSFLWVLIFWIFWIFFL